MQTKFKTILSNFKFYARVNARTYAYAHVCAHLLTEIDRTDIDLNPDKYEWEMTIRYEDMIISWFSQNGA